MDDLSELRSRLRAFAAARNWEQFHTPKNLAMALCGEVGELAAELQWLDDDGATEGIEEGPLAERLADETADVLLYLIRFADICGIDLVTAALIKIERNEARYPSDLARGSPAKYTEFHRRGPESNA
jgi:dCTP diphosphatase